MKIKRLFLFGFIFILVFTIVIFNGNYYKNSVSVDNKKMLAGNTDTNSIVLVSGTDLIPTSTGTCVSTDENIMIKNSFALQNAIDTVSNNGGGEVVMPSGKFCFYPIGKLSTGKEPYAIRLRNNVLLRGQGTTGSSATILLQYNEFTEGAESSGMHMFFFNNYKEIKESNYTSLFNEVNSSSFDYKTRTVSYSYLRMTSANNTVFSTINETKTLYLVNADFKDFVVDGTYNDANAYDSAGKAFMVNLFADCDWENVVVKNINATGFGMDSPINCSMKNCKAINCGKMAKKVFGSSTMERAPGGSGFGIGTGTSDRESMVIDNCISLNNGKFGFFFEHQGRFRRISNAVQPYTATTSQGFVVKNSFAGGNMFDFGGLQANDVVYENVKSVSNYSSYDGVTIEKASSCQYGTVCTKYNPAKFTLFSKNVYFANGDFTNNVSFSSNSDKYNWAINRGLLDLDFGNQISFGENNPVTKFDVIYALYKYNNMPTDNSNGIKTLDYSPYDYFDELKQYFTTESTFADIQNINYSNYYIELKENYVQRDLDAVKWAYTRDPQIIKSAANLNYSNECTRAEFVTMLYRMAGTPEVSDYSGIANFTDINTSSYYYNAVAWAVNNGITNGTSETTFAPNNTITKGQLAVFLYRYDNMNRKTSNIKYYLLEGTMKSGESNPTSYIQNSSTNISLKEPIKTGYTFAGWTGSGLTSNTKNLTFSTNNKTGDLIYTANWSPISYSINYDLDGGTSVSNPTSANYNELFLVNPTTKKITVKFSVGSGITVSNSNDIVSAYTFNGWRVTGMDSTPHNYGGLTTTGTSIIGTTAKSFMNLRATSGTVTFTAKWGAPTITLPTVSKTGSSCNWVSDANQTYDSGSKYTPEASGGVTTITFTAVCSENNYYVKYNANGGSGTMSSDSFTIDVPQNLSSNTFTKTGYTFNGWNTKSDATGTSYANGASVTNLTTTVGETVNLYAQWKANTYTIKYNANGGSGTMSDTSATYDKNVNLRSNSFSRVYYTFKGWNTKADGTGTSYANGASVKNLTATNNGVVTLYAQWNTESYTINYNANGGSGTMSSTTAAYGASVALKYNTFIRTGYYFEKWNTRADGTGTSYSEGLSVTNLGDTTLYALWKANTYTIKYDSNGGSGTMSDTTATYGSSISLRNNTFTRTNHAFVEWNTKADGTGTSYADGAVVKNLTTTNNAVITLYAQWREENNSSYSISYTVDDVNKILDDIALKTTLSSYQNHFTLHGYTMSISLGDKQYVYTGSKVNILKNGATEVTYTNIVRGDTSGDGIVNSADMLQLRQHMLSAKQLTGVYFKAGDIDKNNSINSADLLRMRQHLLGVKPIS